MIEVTELYDAKAPHKRFFLFDSGVRVKIHAKAASAGFGRVQWTMTGSHCGEDGKALAYADGFAIHPDAHELVIASDADVPNEERAARIEASFAAALEKVARRVEAAVLNEQAAGAASAGPTGAPDA